MSATPVDVDALVALDARSWAQLLRSLRLLDGLPDPLGPLLEGPTSELSSGPRRRQLCEALAAAGAVRDRLLEDRALPVAVLAALGSVADPAAGHDPDRLGPHGEDLKVAAQGADDPDERAEQRARALRRSLEEERRRREGAEARALTAQSRADELRAERDALRGELEAREAELRVARDAVDQAAARAERRAGSRVTDLERELASERSALAALRREHDRSRSELEAAVAELETLRSRSAPARAAAPASHGRPLVLPPELEDGTTEAARWLLERATLLLVDGYNAALLLRPGRPLEEQRRWLVDRLRPLATRGGAAPVVVFDGAGVSGTMRDTGGVEVRFTAGGVIADDEIVFAVAATDAPVLVVTDDVELVARVRAEGGNTVGVVHLAGIVER